jgi:hypothetical protein
MFDGEYFFRRSRGHQQRLNKNIIFLASVNNKRNVEIDIPASSGSQGKYVNFISVPWFSLEAALSIFNVSLFLVKKLIKLWITDMNAES